MLGYNSNSGSPKRRLTSENDKNMVHIRFELSQKSLPNLGKFQCDQIFDQKVAQIYPKVSKNGHSCFFLETLCF